MPSMYVFSLTTASESFVESVLLIVWVIEYPTMAI